MIGTKLDRAWVRACRSSRAAAASGGAPRKKGEPRKKGMVYGDPRITHHPDGSQARATTRGLMPHK